MAETDPEKRQGFTQTIGYYMKLAYTNWHREPVHDDMIRTELSALTGGLLQYEPGGYKVHFDARSAYKQRNQPQSGNRNFNKNTSGRSQGQGGQRGNFNGGSYGNGYNKNRKFNKNKSK
jgi:hypothetical protein